MTVISALGMMSGTSLDGLDVVRVDTDGEALCRVEGRFYKAYSDDLRARLGHVARGGDVALTEMLRLERVLSLFYAEVVLESGLLPGVQVVGCHGQTLRHLPAEGITWQMGDANLLAEKLGVPVVMDFRRRDMAAGGQGAPLVPLFHAQALMGEREGAWAVLNIGGVANVTYGDGTGGVFAADCGPGVGLVDAWVEEFTGHKFDQDGALALAGKVDTTRVVAMAEKVGFWQRAMPRSADRYEFLPLLETVRGLSVEDGAATLCAMTAAGVDRTLREMGAEPAVVQGIYGCGGGALNPGMMAALQAFGWRVGRVEDVSSLKASDVEAACFAWLAVRRVRCLTTTLPTTTGCVRATVGGILTA